jgi:predicted nucleic acid-binding protein
MSPVVVDASLWVARLVPQDVHHEWVKAWMDKQRSAGVEFLSPSLLLAEVGRAISRRTNSSELAKQALEGLKNLPGLRIVEMDSHLMQEAAQLAVELGTRGADSTYVAVAAILEIPLITLDADQKSRAANRVSIIDLPT